MKAMTRPFGEIAIDRLRPPVKTSNPVTGRSGATKSITVVR
jgi:hypothetical protein